jgi:hypothetical protein
MQNNKSEETSRAEFTAKPGDTKNIIERLLQNPESVSNLGEEQISKLEKDLSPLGIILPSGGPKLVNFSILNLRDNYLRRMHLTSLIGYVYRTLEEFDPFEFKDILSDLESKEIERVYRAGGNGKDKSLLEKDQIKSIIKLFLDRNFNFNPDLHVRHAGRATGTESKTAVKDKEAVAKEILSIRDRCSNAKTLDLPLSKKITESMQEKYLSFIPAEHQEAFKKDLLMLEKTTSDYSTLVAACAKDSSNAISACIKMVEEAKLNEAMADEVGIFAKNRSRLDTLRSLLETNVETKLAETGKYTVNNLPPAEVFHHWDRYLSNHYEVIRDIVAALYYDQPDLEFAVQFFDAFSGERAEEEAKKHRFMHEAAMICPMLTVETGRWALLGPFKENRDKVEFYSKNAEILKKIMDQTEADNKLGGQIVKRVVHREKAKNIRDFGPDDKGLEEYKSIVGTIDRLKTKPALTKEEKDKLEEAYRAKEMLEVPDNAIQMDVYKPNEEGKIIKDKIYIEAEEPKYLNEIENIDVSKLGPIQPRTDSFASESAIFGAHKSTFGTDQQISDNGFGKERSLADAANTFIGLLDKTSNNNNGGNTPAPN